MIEATREGRKRKRKAEREEEGASFHDSKHEHR